MIENTRRGQMARNKLKLWLCVCALFDPPPIPQEITRRVNLTDIWQAAYTAGVVLPKPVAQCRWVRGL